MQFTTLLLAVLPLAAAQYSKSCKNSVLDAKTDVLSADCDDGHNTGTYKHTSIDLNKCLGWDGSYIQVSTGGESRFKEQANRFGLQSQTNGNFGKSCNKCHIFSASNGYPNGFDEWMNCTCAGRKTESTIDLDWSFVNNNFGTLSC